MGGLTIEALLKKRFGQRRFKFLGGGVLCPAEKFEKTWISQDCISRVFMMENENIDNQKKN